MRPLKLTMSAFGCYADVQTIDFAELGVGLYLIAGETGSGKTTIFDAISFALFGKASGAGRDDYAMLRSDFAEDKAKTYVELDFACGEGSYSVRRAIRRTGQEVELTLSDGTVMSGDRNTKAKIAEIVGLDRDQFAQIVMIAQNDFMRFLSSGTDERLAILRRIFGTGALKQFQERLKARSKRERERRELIIHDFERHGVDVYRREERFAEWAAQIAADRAALAAADGRLAQCDKAKQALAAALAVAEELGKKFADLAACRATLEAHAGQAAEIERARRRAARGETALRAVRPLALDAARAAANHQAALDALDAARRQEAAALEELRQAAQAVGGLPPLAEAQSALAARTREWEAVQARLKKLDQLKASRAEIAAGQERLSAAQTAYESAEAAFAEADGRHRALEAAFLRNQAGVLARGLADGHPCPVCGSKEHPSPAALSDEAVSEEGLKKARAAKEKAGAQREQQSAACGALAAEVETLIRVFLTDFAAFSPDADWAQSGPALAALLSHTRGEAAALTAQREADERALAELTRRWEAATGRKTAAESAHQAATVLTSERTANARKLSGLSDDAKARYAEALRAHRFADEAAYLAALVTEAELANLKRQVADYEKDGERLERDTLRLTRETADREQPDLAALRADAAAVAAEASALSARRDEVKARLNQTSGALAELRRAAVDFDAVERAYAAVKQLAETANGKLDFETYAQTAYFERILRAANQRLKLMSQHRYTLLRQTASGDGRRRSGLEIEVLDAYTGKARPANSLSGGESFMASLSLALGLSDVVQQSAGGIRLDAMFIDEGFGSLDAEVLDLAIRTLGEMAGADRTIGIISHVSELRERIDRQVWVEKTPAGSRVHVNA
ncbi:MAG: SMC family ATPase [Christensenellaceae bacterium]|nr:SMC family ATPase [Christensenellaceae bacterium]